MAKTTKQLLAENPGAEALHDHGVSGIFDAETEPLARSASLRGRRNGEITALLLNDYAAAEFLGVSRATFWRRVADGTLPKPVRLGGATRWRRDALMAAVDALSAKSDD